MPGVVQQGGRVNWEVQLSTAGPTHEEPETGIQWSVRSRHDPLCNLLQGLVEGRHWVPCPYPSSQRASAARAHWFCWDIRSKISLSLQGHHQQKPVCEIYLNSYSFIPINLQKYHYVAPEKDAFSFPSIEWYKGHLFPFSLVSLSNTQIIGLLIRLKNYEVDVEMLRVLWLLGSNAEGKGIEDNVDGFYHKHAISYVFCILSWAGILDSTKFSIYAHEIPFIFFLLILNFRINQLHPWKVPCFKGKCNVGTCTVRNLNFLTCYFAIWYLCLLKTKLFPISPLNIANFVILFLLFLK